MVRAGCEVGLEAGIGPGPGVTDCPYFNPVTESPRHANRFRRQCNNHRRLEHGSPTESIMIVLAAIRRQSTVNQCRHGPRPIRGGVFRRSMCADHDQSDSIQNCDVLSYITHIANLHEKRPHPRKIGRNRGCIWLLIRLKLTQSSQSAPDGGHHRLATTNTTERETIHQGAAAWVIGIAISLLNGIHMRGYSQGGRIYSF